MSTKWNMEIWKIEEKVLWLDFLKSTEYSELRWKYKELYNGNKNLLISMFYTLPIKKGIAYSTKLALKILSWEIGRIKNW